eukprot:TRINITY_DN8488_c0_g1_i1.p1 TRINITY_DN8488_c0_g1~~TRINITY_DN8488_c0_g1_i1.p1  ORF type:complete len:186 (+),score=100.36 TRINITY_DN8488_c0_g1_i1:46-558(+)
MAYNPESPLVQLRTRYPDLTKAKYEEIIRNFRRFDQDSNGVLDEFEIKLLLESVGETKTHLECKQLIAEVDTTRTGTINFSDFLSMILTPTSERPLTLLGRIYQSELAGKAKFFEEQIRDNQGLTQNELEARVKREAAIRKEEREEKIKAKQKAESKARFAERFSQFTNK